MSSSARRIASRLVTPLAVAVTVLCAYNVFGDNAEVEIEARRVAGCTDKCQLIGLDKNPVEQRFMLSKSGVTVVVRCSRSAWLVGSYSCK